MNRNERIYEATKTLTSWSAWACPICEVLSIQPYNSTAPWCEPHGAQMQFVSDQCVCDLCIEMGEGYCKVIYD